MRTATNLPMKKPHKLTNSEGKKPVEVAVKLGLSEYAELVQQQRKLPVSPIFYRFKN